MDLVLVSSIVHKFKYHYYSKLRNTQLFLIFFCINHRIKNNEKIIKIDDKLIFTFLKHIQKYKNYQPISIFKNLNNKFHFIIQEVVEAPNIQNGCKPAEPLRMSELKR